MMSEGGQVTLGLDAADGRRRAQPRGDLRRARVRPLIPPRLPRSRAPTMIR